MHWTSKPGIEGSSPSEGDLQLFFSDTFFSKASLLSHASFFEKPLMAFH